MKKINKLLMIAKDEARRKDEAEISKVFERLSMDQLKELAFGDPSESRVKEILAAVDGLLLLESG